MAADSTHADTLSPNAREIFTELCDSLPRKPNDTEEAVAARARRAMETIVALNPEDALEARLAVRVVTMDAHAADCLRAAGLATGDAAEVNRCRARAAWMARLSESALRTLRRMRAERDKAYNDMHPAAMGRAGYWFKEVSVACPGPRSGARPGPRAWPRAATCPRPGTRARTHPGHHRGRRQALCRDVSQPGQAPPRRARPACGSRLRPTGTGDRRGAAA